MPHLGSKAIPVLALFLAAASIELLGADKNPDPVIQNVQFTFQSGNPYPIQMDIVGANFGNVRPVVTLEGLTQSVTLFTDTQVTVAPLTQTLEPGSYLLILANMTGKAKTPLTGQFHVTIGTVGPQGLQGPAGPAGPKGDTGAAGATGSQGPIGPAGAKGDTGATGTAGPAGPQGSPGPGGPMGPVGPVGPQGPTGPVGQAGLAGLQQVTRSVMLPAGNSSVVLNVPCPAGKRVIGGGCDAASGFTGYPGYVPPSIGKNQPDGADSWTCLFYGESTLNRPVAAIAICATVQ